MHRDSRYFFASCLLTAALAAPTALRAASAPQENGSPEDRDRRNEQEKNRRIYDRGHADYHLWDDAEDRRYHDYLTEKHKDYRPFNELKPRDQAAYWTWRHSHQDEEHRDEHHDQRR